MRHCRTHTFCWATGSRYRYAPPWPCCGARRCRRRLAAAACPRPPAWPAPAAGPAEPRAPRGGTPRCRPGARAGSPCPPPRCAVESRQGDRLPSGMSPTRIPTRSHLKEAGVPRSTLCVRSGCWSRQWPRTPAKTPSQGHAVHVRSGQALALNAHSSRWLSRSATCSRRDTCSGHCTPPAVA